MQGYILVRRRPVASKVTIVLLEHEAVISELLIHLWLLVSRIAFYKHANHGSLILESIALVSKINITSVPESRGAVSGVAVT